MRLRSGKMANEYRVVVEGGDSGLRMMTTAELKAEEWEERSGFGDHMNEIVDVVDENGKTAGKYMAWTQPSGRRVYVSEATFPKGKVFRIDPNRRV